MTPKSQALYGHTQESGCYGHHLLKFILLKGMGEQGGETLGLQKSALATPGESPSLAPVFPAVLQKPQIYSEILLGT